MTTASAAPALARQKSGVYVLHMLDERAPAEGGTAPLPTGMDYRGGYSLGRP